MLAEGVQGGVAVGLELAVGVAVGAVQGLVQQERLLGLLDPPARRGAVGELDGEVDAPRVLALSLSRALMRAASRPGRAGGGRRS